MKAKNTVLIIGSLFIFLFLISCKEKVIFKNAVKIPNNIWQINDTLTFRADISDNKNYYNIFITVDAKKNYLTNNIWLIINSKSPSGNLLNDTVMFFIFDQKGKPYGKESGDIVKNKFLYKAHIIFPEKGTYTFTIRHGMRKTDLPRVSSAGICIEK